MLEHITPLLITWNEEDNLERTLARLGWAQRVVVLDSGSTDATLEIAGRFANADVVTRPFDTFAGQCNFGLAQVRTAWVLSLDADYELTSGLIEEIDHLRPAPDTGGYRVPFVYCVHGRPLRGSLYPPRTVLYRVDGARYRDEGHSQRVEIPGRIEALANTIRHDDRKPLGRWLDAQRGYARTEADYLLEAPAGALGWKDRIRRRAILAPFLVLAYTLFGARVVLDGWPGWFYALQRTMAEVLIALELIDRRLRDASRRDASA